MGHSLWRSVVVGARFLERVAAQRRRSDFSGHCGGCCRRGGRAVALTFSDTVQMVGSRPPRRCVIAIGGRFVWYYCFLDSLDRDADDRDSLPVRHCGCRAARLRIRTLKGRPGLCALQHILSIRPRLPALSDPHDTPPAVENHPLQLGHEIMRPTLTLIIALLLTLRAADAPKPAPDLKPCFLRLLYISRVPV